MVTLKVVMLLILDDALNVNVAATDAPVLNVAPCLFQVKVIGPLALVGFQFVVVMLNVTWVLPVFLT
jgi:hypothetical protein